MTTLLFLLLLLLVLRSLGHPTTGSFRDRPGSWSEGAHRVADDALAGVRVLSRLDAARRDRVGRPWR